MKHLKIGNFDAVELAKKFGTPLYIYDGNKIEENYKKIYNSISYEPKQILYAIMANNRIPILKIFLKLGSFLQVNSVKELYIAKKAGFPESRISVTTTNISEKDMEIYIKHKVLLNLDSIEEVERYGKIIEKYRKEGIDVIDKIGIRVFVHVKETGGYVTNKPYEPKARVGIRKEQFDKLKEIAKKYDIKIIGVHGYFASNVLDVDPILKLSKYLVDVAKEFEEIEFINIGGGFGVPTKENQKDFDWKTLDREINNLMKDISSYFNRKIILKLEPGRSLVADAGYLITQVTNIKDMGSWTQVGVDCGFGIFARPYIYGWKDRGYHPIIVANKIDQKADHLYTVCANSVLQQDYLAEDIKLPKVEVGDYLAILKTGAYGATMMSLFPGRNRPGEILIYNNNLEVIEKTEKFDL